MIISKAALDDIQSLVTLWLEFMEYHYERDEYYNIRNDAVDYHIKFLKSVIDKDGWSILLANEGDNIIGYSVAKIENYPPVFSRENFGFIQELAVKADYRSKGIGEILLNEQYKWFRLKNISQVELHVAIKNSTAESFWKSKGFTPVYTTYIKNIQAH
ncbi:MAG: GNAT family N-acetyltransferase [Bacteroidetes bacterium]|nr:GNAT family N-acetyltransferase [Bacteroidota bacterium]